MELSSDMVEEILSWLPATSLARLRYTCKNWETLIADTRFVKKHSSHMLGREKQFTVFNNAPYSKVPHLLGSTVSCLGIDFDELNNPCLNRQVFKPVSSPSLLVKNMYHCDGLLLFVMRSKLLVLNPLLKQAKWVRCGYGFDHKMDVYGLGYISNQSSSSSYDYRMVRFRCGASDGGGNYKGSRVEVYDFKSDSWRVFVDKSFDGFLELPESSVCLRGTPYWIGYLNGKNFPTIQSFDFSKERFDTFFLPPSSNGSPNLENSLSLGVFRGDRLSLLHKSRLTGKIQLWVMKKHWSKLMTFAIPEFAMSPRYSSFFVENNGKLVVSIPGIRSINFYIVGKDDECQNVEYPSTGGSGCYYVPSLLTVPGFSEAKRRSGFSQKRDDF